MFWREERGRLKTTIMLCKGLVTMVHAVLLLVWARLIRVEERVLWVVARGSLSLVLVAIGISRITVTIHCVTQVTMWIGTIIIWVSRWVVPSGIHLVPWYSGIYLVPWYKPILARVGVLLLVFRSCVGSMWPPCWSSTPLLLILCRSSRVVLSIQILAVPWAHGPWGIRSVVGTKWSVMWVIPITRV